MTMGSGSIAESVTRKRSAAFRRTEVFEGFRGHNRKSYFANVAWRSGDPKFSKVWISICQLLEFSNHINCIF